jgi:hypothetical protein
VNDLHHIFARIFQHNGFGGRESISGPGSSLESTETLRVELPGLLRSFGIRRIVDAPCGDMNWMRHLPYEFDLYIGVDIVQDLIERLRTEISSEKFHFQTGNICSDILPAADAIFCRDCFGHLSFENIRAATRLFKRSGAAFLITTTFCDKKNEDMSAGGWRQIDLQNEPFLWPAPMRLIRENAPDREDRWTATKSLGIWTLASLPD